MDDAKWYFTHESDEDRLWYRIFFSMCRKFGVSWSKASEMQKAFIEELTRINFEREMTKKSAVVQPIRGFFDTEIPACPTFGKKRAELTDGKVSKTMFLHNKNTPKVLNSGTPRASNHLVRTERWAHVEIVPSTTGEILPQKPGFFL